MESIESMPEGLVAHGATITKLALDKIRTCQYHKLHLPFLPCGERALYVLTKECGAHVPLCQHHAFELRQRFDDSSPANPRGDGSYGWPMGQVWDGRHWIDDAPLNLAAPNITDDTERWPAPVMPPQPSDFAGGLSGGAGGGASYTQVETTAFDQQAMRDQGPVAEAADGTLSYTDVPVVEETRRADDTDESQDDTDATDAHSEPDEAPGTATSESDTEADSPDTSTSDTGEA
jgi:hypothetical protein